MKLLTKNNIQILEPVYGILARIYKESEIKKNVEQFIDSLAIQLQLVQNDAHKTRVCVSALKVLLQKSDYRILFYRSGAIP